MYDPMLGQDLKSLRSALRPVSQQKCVNGSGNRTWLRYSTKSNLKKHLHSNLHNHFYRPIGRAAMQNYDDDDDFSE